MNKTSKLEQFTTNNIEYIDKLINNIKKSRNKKISLLSIFAIICCIIGLFIPGFCLFAIIALIFIYIRHRMLRKYLQQWQDELMNLKGAIIIQEKEIQDLDKMIRFKTNKLLKLNQELSKIEAGGEPPKNDLPPENKI